MKALVTGATGLIGSHMVDRLLQRGDSVRALVRPTGDTSYLKTLDVELVPGDICDPASLRDAVAGVEAVYHAAAMVSDWGPWSAFAAGTIEGTRNMLEAACAAGVPRFLHVSTDSVYPTRPKLKGITIAEDYPLEKHPPAWDYYQRSKLAAERIAWDYHNSARIQLSAVRPTLVLGERDRSIIPEILAYLRAGRAVYVGRPEGRWHCIYAGDLAEACILAATREEAIGQVYNLGAEALTQREFFAAVAEEIGVSPPRRTLPFWPIYLYGALSETWARFTRSSRRPTMTRFGALTLAQDYILDTTKIERELGWKAQVSVREAIRLSIEWLKTQREPQRAVG